MEMLNQHQKINEEMASESVTLLKNNGILYMVHRPERLDEIIILASKYKLNVKEIALIVTNKSMIPTLILVKCVKNSKNGLKFRKIYDVSKCTTYQHIFDCE